MWVKCCHSAIHHFLNSATRWRAPNNLYCNFSRTQTKAHYLLEIKLDPREKHRYSGVSFQSCPGVVKYQIVYCCENVPGKQNLLILVTLIRELYLDRISIYFRYLFTVDGVPQPLRGVLL